MCWSNLYKVVLCLATVFCMAVFSGCQPAAYTRYQSAHTLGKGEMQLLAASHIAPAPHGRAANDMEKDMDDKLEKWEETHGHGDADFEEAVEEIMEAIFVEPGRVISNAVGMDMEVIYSVGVADNVDIELRATITGYLRGNTKIKLADLGSRGALAISPGIGWRGFSYENDDDDYKDQYRGNLFTGELPLIFGWKWEKASLYFAPTYIYHRVNIRYTRDTYNLPLNFNGVIEEKLDFHVPGVVAGVETHVGHFIFTPEVGFFYYFSEKGDGGFLSPGMAIGGRW